MVVYKKTHSVQSKIAAAYLSDFHDSLFFDIETVGFFWKTSHLYLIGAVSFEDGHWVVRQWFLNQPAEEVVLLKEFSDLCAGFRRVVHYNGDNFDIPYLRHKYLFYRMTCPLDRPDSLDLYRVAKPLKKFLGLSFTRQKDLENFLGISRSDLFSGKELISVYADYLHSGNKDMLAILLQHNLDDVCGLANLTPLLGYADVLNGGFEIAGATFGSSTLSISLNLPNPIAIPITHKGESFTLKVRQNGGTLSVPAYTGTLKHFFPDYKNYYYLPQEDQAIHKSVGVYVNRQHRENAKASNCYQNVSGVFLPQAKASFQPVFSVAYRQKPSFFLFQEAFLQDMPALYKYARQFLSQI